MPIPQELLNQLKCCLSDDGHISVDAVVFECGGNACKICVSELLFESNKCYSCDQIHEKKDLIKSPSNTLAKTLIKLNLNELFEYLDDKFREVNECLKGK
jgi:hypothetical protein